MHDTNTFLPDRRPHRSRSTRLAAATLGASLALLPWSVANAAGEVAGLRTEARPATPSRYAVDGVDYAWGQGENTWLEGFSSDGREFGHTLAADRVEVYRDDVPEVAGGDRCGVFAERTGEASTSLAPDYPGDGSADGNCDTAAMLASRVINRGALDLFSNRAPDANNVERVDYLFDSGLLAPVTPEGLSRAGHVVAEKGGNNRLKIAAVLSLDVLGQPASYGPTVLVREIGCSDPELCYGVTDLTHDYAFFRNEPFAPQGFPTAGRQSTESVAMAFVSSARLGLEVGQRYFGFSLFADDVDTDDHDLLDPTTFPDDTQDERIAEGDSADVYGGLSGWYVDESLSNGSGRVFLDANGDGVPNEDESGIADMQILVYLDTDGDGVFDPTRDEPVCNATDTDRNGVFVLPGLPDGDYFVVVRENDPDLPPDLVLTSVNPRPFTIAGIDDDTLDFAFVAASGGPDGGGTATAGGTTTGSGDGTTTAGGTTSGGEDGTATAGTATAGGEDGTATAGTATSGGEDGTATAGTATAGGEDGTATAGTATAGGEDGTATAGTATAGGEDGAATAGTATAGGEDGAATAGTATAGGEDGAATAGTATTGGEDGTATAGTATAGGEDGTATAGTATAGGEDGTATAGTATAGGEDGTTTAGTATAGGEDGAATAGTATAGGEDGAATAGTATTGGEDGTATAGTATAGGEDGTATAGTATAGGEDGTATAGTATAGGEDGTATAGTATAGGEDGTATAGTATAGGEDGTATAGTATAGGEDGAATAGTATAGGEDGAATAGTATAGGEDGTATAGTGTTGGGEPDPGASRDDPVTSAQRDFFTLRQDAGPTALPVLDNDTDASGLGLTIIRVDPSANATVEVNADGSAIVYESTRGFSGLDNFIYVIEDGDGTRTSGTVSVEVLRFRDVNGNQIDDFVECGCTDLTLETGVHGSGVGRLSFVALGLLAGIGALRLSGRRRRFTEGGR